MSNIVSIFKRKTLTATNINKVIKKAYELSCYGDHSAVDVLKSIDTLETFYIHQVALEAILYNLKAYKEAPT